VGLLLGKGQFFFGVWVVFFIFGFGGLFPPKCFPSLGGKTPKVFLLLAKPSLSGVGDLGGGFVPKPSLWGKKTKGPFLFSGFFFFDGTCLSFFC